MAVNEEEARNISEKQIEFLQKEDPFFELLRGAVVGRPVLVKTVWKQPSYWLVPLSKEGKISGFVRVLLNGKVAHLGTFHEHTTDSPHSRTLITGISELDASKLAANRIRKELGESASEPVFIHDGPIGREAWLVEITKDSKPIRWVFISNELIYERSCGKLPNGFND